MKKHLDDTYKWRHHIPMTAKTSSQQKGRKWRKRGEDESPREGRRKEDVLLFMGHHRRLLMTKEQQSATKKS